MYVIHTTKKEAIAGSKPEIVFFPYIQFGRFPCYSHIRILIGNTHCFQYIHTNTKCVCVHHRPPDMKAL